MALYWLEGVTCSGKVCVSGEEVREEVATDLLALAGSDRLGLRYDDDRKVAHPCQEQVEDSAERARSAAVAGQVHGLPSLLWAVRQAAVIPHSALVSQ